MKRTLILALIFLFLGVSIGLAWTTIDTGQTQERFLGSLAVKSDFDEVEPLTEVKAIVYMEESAELDFGELDFGEQGEHVFTVKNDGNEELTVEYFTASCGKCIRTDFQQALVAPGDHTTIKVEYMVQKAGPRFLEYVEFRTTDPDRPVLRLSVKGTVQKRLRLSQNRLAVGRISNSEASVHTLQLYDYRNESPPELDYEWRNPELGKFMEVEFTPSAETVAEGPAAPKSVVDVKIKFLAGAPIGPIRQVLTINCLSHETAPLEVTMKGEVTGDFSFVGARNFDRNTATLRLGKVKREEGHKEVMRLLVRGENRADIKITVGLVDPAEVLKVTVGEAQAINDGAILMYPIEIEVPAGVPPINRLGFAQGKVGRILLETTHALNKEIPINVAFVTE